MSDQPINRSFLSTLTTNVKGSARTIRLSKRVLIIGNNATGKSAIGQSATLIYGGYADGIDGRNGVKGSRLIGLASVGQALFVTGVFSDGQTAKAEMKAEGGRLNRSADFAVDYATPVNLVREVLQSSDEVARQAFLRWATSSLTDEAIKKMVPPDLSAVFNPGYSSRSGDTPVDKLIAMREWSRKSKADRMKEMKGAQKTADTLVVPTVPVDEADVTAAEVAAKKMQRLREAFVGWQAREESRQQKADLVSQSVAAMQTIEEAQDERTALDNLIVKLAEQMLERPNRRDQRALLRAAADVLMLMPEGGTCPVSGAVLSAEWVAERSAAIDVELTDELADRLSNLRAARATVVDKIDRASIEYQRLTQQIAAMPADEEAVEEVTVEQVDRANAQWTKLSADRRAWQQYDAAKARVRSLKKEADQFGEVETVVDEMIERLLKANLSALVVRWNERLPEGWTVSLTVEPFNWSIDKGDGLQRSVLSGSEFETVLLALADAIMESVGYDGPALATPDDRGWSPDGLTKMMRAMSQSSCQVLVESTVEPEEEVDGWTVIRLSDQPVSQSVEQSVEQPVVKEVAETAATVLPDHHAKYLKILGYSGVDLAGMSAEEAQAIIRSGRRKA